MSSVIYDFSGVKNLDKEGWKKIGNFAPEEVLLARHAALFDLENTIAKAQGRNPAEIRFDPNLPSGDGKYDSKSNTMFVCKADVEGDVPPNKAVSTVAHEGRHDYQHHVKDHPNDHPEISEFIKARWSHNLLPENYVKSKDDLFGYLNQAVEIDCRQFANLVERQVCGERLGVNHQTGQGPLEGPVNSPIGLERSIRAHQLDHAMKTRETASISGERPPEQTPPAIPDWKNKWASHVEKTKIPAPPPPATQSDTPTKLKGPSR